MALKWYSVVVDCHDVASQARWWADVLDWQAIYEAADEVVIVPGCWPGATLADVGQPAAATFNVLRDPEGNELCVLSAREG
jgi:hypothetical protein